MPQITQSTEQAGGVSGAADENGDGLRAIAHARCPDSVLVAQARFRLARDRDRVMACLRNLGCLVDWWPAATRIVAAPPGVYAVGDVALLELAGAVIVVRVIAYKPASRIVLSLQRDEGRLLVDLRVCDDGTGCTLSLTMETPRVGTMLAQTLQGLRLRALCRQAAARLGRHLVSAVAPAQAPDDTLRRLRPR
jgi:hypothetical protein